MTRDRILDAAERLFAEHGVAATSLRAIMKEAGTNMAAIHYHFGSRSGLLAALMERRAAPVNRRRVEMLDLAERRYPDGLLPADEVVRAFFEPVIELMQDPARSYVSRLIGRVAMEASDPESIRRVFGPTLKRFVAAARRAAPHLSEEEAQARMHFLVGAMVFAVSVPCVPASAGPATPAGMRTMFEDLIGFAAAGLVAGRPVRTEGEQQ